MTLLALGIDVSTTATKALVVDDEGSVVGSASSSYAYDVPQRGWSEQTPSVWWDAACEAIGAVLASSGLTGADIGSVGLTGQMHGSVLLDGSGEAIRPAILWNDQRTARECDEIRQRVGRDRLIAITGNDALTGFTAPKLLWVANNEPEHWRRVESVLLPKDYLRFRLTGERAVDAAGGSGTILFDLAKRQWSPEILDALGIDPSICASVFEGPQVTGSVSREAARSSGLREGTPVMAGGGDQSANAVGVGAVSPGVVALSLGTSGVVFATSDEPTIDPAGSAHAFCHAVPGKWHMMSVMLSAAGSLRWLRDVMAPDTAFERLSAGASQVDPGSEGLLFLPYLSGERTPHNDPLAAGAFVGLNVSHDLRHLTRSVMEGVAFGLRDGLELMTRVGVARPESIRASGGGTRSSLWRQILADVLDARVDLVGTEEGAAFGAALLGLVGRGSFGSVEAAVEAVVSVEPSTTPGPHAEVYDEAYSRYRDLYPALKPTFHSLSG